MKILVKSIIAAVAIFILLRACSPQTTGSHPLIGQLAPNFTLGTLSDQNKTMSLTRDGQSAIIFFWAVWCPHCRRQLTALTQQQADIEKKGIKIILVNVGEDLRKVKDYFSANNISSDVFLDQNSAVAGNYNIVGVPTFFFVNTEGIIIAAEHSLPSDYENILLGLAP